MITTNPKLAWAKALDSGVRSQLGPIIEELETGGGVQYTRKGGPGAAYGAEYGPVYSCICRMERNQPVLAAIGHVLCHPSTEFANGYLDTAVAAVEERVISNIPNWNDGRAWRLAKKERVHYMIHVALIERQHNLSNEQPSWKPERIGAVMAAWYGVNLVTRKWHQDWLPVWSLIQAAIDHFEGKAMDPISETIGEIIRSERSAA